MVYSTNPWTYLEIYSCGAGGAGETDGVDNGLETGGAGERPGCSIGYGR